MSATSEHRSDETTRMEPSDRAPRRPPPAGPWVDPALAVAMVAGAVALFALVVGIVTLARTGLPVEGMTDATTEVGPFSRSALMGLIEIGLGVVAAAIAASRRAASLTGLGLIAIVFGLVWLIEPQAFGDALGVDRATAWLYLVVGIVSTGAGLWAPDVPAERVVIRS